MVTAQGKEVLQFLAKQSATRSWKDMAKETTIKPSSFRRQLDFLADEGLAEATDSDNLNWVITEQGMKVATGPEGKLSRTDVGLTERQIFEQKGAAIGGITAEKLTVITDIVWSRDPHDLDWVWAALGEGNVPIDTRRTWLSSWRAFLKNSGMPSEYSPALEKTMVAISPDKKEDKKSVEGQDYIIENGEIKRIGMGLGDFNLQDAKEVLAIQNLCRRATSVSTTSAQEGVAKDSLSSLITALTPLLKTETNLEMLKEVLSSKMEAMETELTSKLPAPVSQKTIGDQLTGLIAIIKTLGEAGPTIRGVLGIGEPAKSQQSEITPIQLQNSDGTPVVMDLGKFFEIRRFEADERRKDEAHKGTQAMASEIRNFVGKVGDAVARSAGEK